MLRTRPLNPTRRRNSACPHAWAYRTHATNGHTLQSRGRAQASGLPVVAAAAPGITDVVTHGEGGLLVGLPANATSLAAAAASLLADPPLRRSMGARGVRDAATFTWASSGERMLCE